MIETYSLSEAEKAEVRELLLEITSDDRNLDEHIFLDQALLFAQELPRGLRQILHRFKLHEPVPCLLITNNPILSSDIGPTPSGHANRPLGLPQLLHGLYASLLGEPFGFETQQFGRIFNDLISIEGQPGNSSSGCGKIGLHTEDCVKLFMPDYLGLLCLRNKRGARTLISSIFGREIPTEIRDILMSPIFPEVGGRTKRALLFGSPLRPYLRYGSVDSARCEPDGLRALRYLSETLEAERKAIALTPGDCLYIDNFYGVHGRDPFAPLYGPEARWFCRLVMTRDLRRTRPMRAAPGSRVMIERAC
jgi:L-asparagine oxygenase